MLGIVGGVWGLVKGGRGVGEEGEVSYVLACARAEGETMDGAIVRLEGREEIGGEAHLHRARRER